MPIYNYRCTECGVEFELYFGTYAVAASTEILCTSCRSGQVHKQVSPCSFQLEGEGWAKDGYTYKEKENLKHAQD